MYNLTVENLSDYLLNTYSLSGSIGMITDTTIYVDVPDPKVYKNLKQILNYDKSPLPAFIQGKGIIYLFP